MPKNNRRRIYVGRLDRRTHARDLEDAFRRYGRIRDVELKRDYAFIEFYESRDAEDAVRDMDGRRFDGSRIIVEFAGSGRGDRAQANDGTCFNCGQSGHWANNCKEGDWKDKCYRCGKKGHMKRECTASRSRSRERNVERKEGKERNRGDSEENSRQSRERENAEEKLEEGSESPAMEEYGT
ncbi:unnamed protein product [Blepharisma stoltei]|uniref:Uncharacterized protein n=1 Tax=Blepharisma stoltei TaxID=1481888 RepID=A0AAU9J2V5_9CILI|nr:unnamed protein product [Blepharisma stoltei]